MSFSINRANHPSPIQEMLSGEKAFYRDPEYARTTERDFSQTKLLPVSYTWNTEYKIARIAKQIFAILIFPIGIYHLIHSLVGRVVLLASTPILMDLPNNYADLQRPKILENEIGEWKYKRLTIEIDGYRIDAVIFGKVNTLNNGRWLLASNGNGEFYESKFSPEHDLKRLLTEVNSNGIVFNYPSVGASTGRPNRQAMAKAYRAMLTFLEDQKNGIGAKEIIGYGHSIGAGVQSDALRDHELKKKIKYVFVKSRSFSSISAVVSNPFIGILVKILGWNISSTKVSKKLQAPEIILQTADVMDYEELHSSKRIINDRVITAKASLAKALLEDKNCSKKNKVFIGIPETHNERLSDPAFLGQKIEEMLIT